MLQNYLRTALRTLTRDRSTSMLNILGLSAGMAAAILIFLWVQNELTYDSYHPGADRTYRLTVHFMNNAGETNGDGLDRIPLPLAMAVHTQLPQLEALTTIKRSWNTVFRINGDVFEEKNTAYIDSSWFKVFHYDFIEGSPATFLQQPYNLILTSAKAKKYFGDQDPIGKLIQIDSIHYRVAAIIRENPANSSFPFDVFLNQHVLLANPARHQNEMQTGNYYYQTFVRTQPSANLASLSSTMTRIARSGGRQDSISLTALKAMHFETNVNTLWMAHGSRNTVYIFSILGALLLVIACINYINLTTARASRRAKEVGIRKIVGAGKTSLFGQFLIESLVISTASLLLTALLLHFLFPLFEQFTEKDFGSPFANRGTWQILGFTLLATTLLNGVYPALLLSSFRPLNVLRGITILKFKDVNLRRSLVVLQFTFSLILIIGTIVIQRQLAYVMSTNPGYNRSQVIYFSIPSSFFWHKSDSQSNATMDAIKARLLPQTSIEGITLASESIVNVNNAHSGSLDWDGRDTSFRPDTHQLYADEDFSKVMQMPVSQGRWFDRQRPTDRHKDFVGAASPRPSSSANFGGSFVLNQTAIDEFNIHKPVIGQRFTIHGDTGQIIGVLRDVHFSSLHEKTAPLVVINSPELRYTFFVRTRPGKATQALAASRALFKEYVPDLPFVYDFMDEQFDNLYKSDRKASNLILSFSIVAILISCLGLFGLATFSAQQRIKEVGIRKVLGATVTQLTILLSRDFLRLVLLSALIAIPIAWWAMHQWLQDFAFHIRLNAWIFALAAALSTLVALLTVGSRTFRAARANPVKNLRTD